MREERRSPPLSEREQQLLKLAGEGYTDTAIAHKLGISEATVGTYWGRIRIKMGPYSRTELVGMAIRAEAEATLELLRADNERLSEQLRSKITSGESTQLYFQLLQDAPDAVIVVDKEGKIEYVNNSAADLFSYALEDLLGLHISTLVPERLRDKHRDHVDDYLFHPSKRKMGEHLDTLARRSDGYEFPVAAALSVTHVGGEEHVVCMVRDVTQENVLRKMGTPEGAIEAVPDEAV
jgi:PAS domain S-box-containing protein